MSKLASYRRITPGDLGKVPVWVEVFLGPIQSQLEDITGAMNGGLTMGDNIRSERFLVPMADGVELTMKVKNRPWSGSVAWVEDNRGVSGFAWRIIDNEHVGATTWFKTPPVSGTVKVRLVFLTE